MTLQLKDKELVLRAPIIRSLIAGLGFKSAFDTDKLLIDIYSVYQRSVAGLEEFATPTEVVSLFTNKKTESDGITQNNCRKLLAKILWCAGLELVSQGRTTVRRDDGTQKPGVPVLKLDPGPYLELLRLRLRKDPRRLELPNEHARACLWGEDGQLGRRYEDYPLHRHLIDLGYDPESGLVERAADVWGSDRAMEASERGEGSTSRQRVATQPRALIEGDYDPCDES